MGNAGAPTPKNSPEFDALMSLGSGSSDDGMPMEDPDALVMGEWDLKEIQSKKAELEKLGLKSFSPPSALSKAALGTHGQSFSRDVEVRDSAFGDG